MAVFLSRCPRVNEINGTEGRLTIWAGMGTTWASTARAPAHCKVKLRVLTLQICTASVVSVLSLDMTFSSGARGLQRFYVARGLAWEK